MNTVEMIELKTRNPIGVRHCQLKFRDKMKSCDNLFNDKSSRYYHDIIWHKQCLREASTEFDKCLSGCD